MDEFKLIESIRAGAHADDPLLRLGIGDDAAILDLPPGESLVVSTDTLNQDVHFFPDVAPEDLGHKALAVNLSDLAAMGARPRWATLNFSLPQSAPDWIDRFMVGFHLLAGRHGVSLVGGDTCRGPLSITVTAMGSARKDDCLTRSGARVGDRIMVSGKLGDAALALREKQSGRAVASSLRLALERPVPRVELGRSLVGVATSCIDISDGLLADLGHVCQASHAGASIYLDQLPGSTELMALKEQERWALQLSGGDDYELCFTLDPEVEAALRAMPEVQGLALSCIGEIKAGAGIDCVRPDGGTFNPDQSGFGHFRD